MSTSPSLRLSLRRKRSSRGTQNTGSPASKKSSPTLQEGRSEPPVTPATPKTHSSHYTQRRTRSSILCSPSPPSKDKAAASCGEENSFQTPHSSRWQQSTDVCLRQPSPDMPFLSSQLSGTQECEVVWDCDSPGFSKDDLKRMHSCGDWEGPDKVSPVAPVPHRLLFHKARTRLPQPLSSGNTTAQLHDLLDLLSSKGNAASKGKENVADSHNLQDTIQQIALQSESHSLPSQRSSSSSESPALPRMLEMNSQPFNIERGSEPRGSQVHPTSDMADSEWGDDLNLALCDITSSVFDVSMGSRSERGSDSVAMEEVNKSKIPEKGNVSSASADIFDDDLFSESVILSTQAVEDAMAGKEAKGVNGLKERRIDSPDEMGQNFKPNKHQEVCEVKEKNSSTNIRNRGSANQTVGAINYSTSEHTTYNKPAQLNKNNDFSVHSKVNNSVIDRTKATTEIPPQRQVRRSFKFGNSPIDGGKIVPSATGGRMTCNAKSELENQKHIKNSEKSNDLKESRTLNPNSKLGDSSGLQKPAVSHSLPRGKPSAAATSSNIQGLGTGTQMPQTAKLPSRKSLFRKSEAKEEVVSHGVGNQPVRGPLLRSQSSSDTRFTASSPVARRSNSSVELDVSRDFEDDEFFKSLLSVLPEDDADLADGCTLPLQPITAKGNHGSEPHQMNKFPRSGKMTTENRSSLGNRGTDVYNRSVERDPVCRVANGSPLKTLKEKFESRSRSSSNSLNGRASVFGHITAGPKTLHNTKEGSASITRQPQENDTFDDDGLFDDDDGLFEDDVLSLIDEVESQFGSQNAPPEASPSFQSSQPLPVKCTQDEIARKKAAAKQRREEKMKQQSR